MKTLVNLGDLNDTFTSVNPIPPSCIGSGIVVPLFDRVKFNYTSGRLLLRPSRCKTNILTCKLEVFSRTAFTNIEAIFFRGTDSERESFVKVMRC